VPDTKKELEKLKTIVEKVGLGTIILFTFGYFFMLFFVPIFLLSLIADIISIPISSQLFVLISIVLFVGYFILDLFQIYRNKFTLTMAALIPIVIWAYIIIKAFNGSIDLLRLDDDTPIKVKRRVFPLNLL
jgi:hypothetical protein